MIQFHCSLIPLAVRSTALILALASANIASAQVHNTKTGVSAGASITTGDEDTADGFSALQLTNTGSFDTAVGSLALQKNTAGSSNTAVGYMALTLNTASNNTALGTGAASLAGFVNGIFAFGDEAFQSEPLRLLQENIDLARQGSRVANDAGRIFQQAFYNLSDSQLTGLNDVLQQIFRNLENAGG